MPLSSKAGRLAVSQLSYQLSALRALPTTRPSGKTGQVAKLSSMFCDHTKRIGDNYGVSCRECQAVLEGYGGFFGSNLTGHEPCPALVRASFTPVRTEADLTP